MRQAIYYFEESAYLAQLSDSGVCGFANLLPINGVLSEEQIDLVIFRVVTLWDEIHADKSRIWIANKQCINTSIKNT